jgi:ABC-type branched-subunit amino acid transport system permease subunit
MLIIGVVFITCVMFFPGGIWGTLQHVRWPKRLVWRPA